MARGRRGAYKRALVMKADTPLADIFPRFSEADWRNAVARAARGGTPARESSALLPRARTAIPIAGRPGGQPWVAFGRVEAPSSEAAIASALTELDGGAAGIELASSAGLHPLPARLPTNDVASVLSALPEGTTVRVDVDDPALTTIAGRRGLELVVAFDPVAALATGATSTIDVSRLIALAEANVATAAIADGRPWHAGGASDVQELAAVLATFVHHLRLAGGKIDVALVADADQFRTIAKFRAMRLLLARIGEVAGVAVTARVHAETAWRDMTAREPELNILRATSAAFGAAAAGVDSITVLPFDALSGGDPHGRRLARNTQTILAEEANVFRVADPAAGSGAIEAMTHATAEAAWSRFQKIEAEGGIVAAIRGGGLLREIAEMRDARFAAVASGDVRMIGAGAAPSSPGPAQSDRLLYRRIEEALKT